ARICRNSRSSAQEWGSLNEIFGNMSKLNPKLSRLTSISGIGSLKHCPRPHGSLAITLALTIGVDLAGTATSMDWPRFRGPNGSGVSGATNLPVEFGSGANVAWKTDAPAGISSPVVSRGCVFLTGYEGTHLLTLCFDLISGRRLWQRTVEAVR